MKEHIHNEAFCFTCVVSKIAPLLPRQNPIKDFIHQNMLQVFIDKPFDEAIILAAKLFKARAYMDLSYYRDKFREGKISDSSLRHSIDRNFGANFDNNYRIIHHALFNYSPIFDQTTFAYLLKTNHRLRERLCTAEKIVDQCDEAKDDQAVSLRQLINLRLNCSIDHDVNAILFRLVGSYIDQGVSLWQYLDSFDDFLTAVRKLAEDSSFRLAYFVNNQDFLRSIKGPKAAAVGALLSKMFSSETLYAAYIKESLLHHPGWSGMSNIIAQNASRLPRPRKIDLESLFMVKLALEWQFIKHRSPSFLPITKDDVCEAEKKNSATHERHRLALTYFLCSLPKEMGYPSNTVVKSINLITLQKTWADAFELTYYRSVAKTISTKTKDPLDLSKPKKFQALFCIDDREYSFACHLENESSDIKTYGFPGFFGIDCFFLSHKSDLLEKRCPINITAQHVVIERGQSNAVLNRQNMLIELASFITRHGANSILFGFVSAYTLGHLSLFRLLLSFFQPLKIMKAKELMIKEEKTYLLFERTDNMARYKNFFLGYSEEEMATRIFSTLKSIGLTHNFASVIFIIGHGSSSVNNPHFAAYDCGACSSKPGSINARVFASMANIKNVRNILKNWGITIPHETIFVGGYHDTCTDNVEFFDLDKLTATQTVLVKEFSTYAYKASEKNAAERCKLFALVSPHISEQNALRETAHRAKALFEPRPELGHTNVSLCIIGRKRRIYKKDFKRRSFFQSYDPNLDPDGQILASILSGTIPVCGGINFDYYFSRVDPAIYGSGTKLSHNVCGLVGVGHGLDDDLRTGLPIQMTELHEPIRLLIVIEQHPHIILKAINSNPELVPWVMNSWVKIASLNITTDHLSLYDPKSGVFSDEHLFPS